MAAALKGKSKTKKTKVDFGAMVAGREHIQSNAQVIQQKSSELRTAVYASTDSSVDSLRRICHCGLCDDDTIELLLVCRLGLDGLDAFRSAMQSVPAGFLSRKVSFVMDIVNLVLKGKKPLSEEECDALLSLCSSKAFFQRRTDERAFEKEQMHLTAKTGKGYNGFLAPPVTCCLNVGCSGRKLVSYTEPTNVTIFGFDGARPGSKITLKCSLCNTNYGYSMYGNKLVSGSRFYDQERHLVETSDVVFVERNLYRMFVSLR